MPKWARTRRGEFAEVQRNAKCGLLSTDDVVNGRVLLTIAGSRTTVKRGREEVIKLLTGDGRYKEGAIRLRRIRDQSVDTAGFREAGPVSEEDVSNCAGAFDWERYAYGARVEGIQRRETATYDGLAVRRRIAFACTPLQQRTILDLRVSSGGTLDDPHPSGSESDPRIPSSPNPPGGQIRTENESLTNFHFHCHCHVVGCVCSTMFTVLPF